MQYSVHLPTPFIEQYWPQLLPDWPLGVASILIVLQPAHLALLERSTATERKKQVHRETFLQWGQAIANQLREAGYLAEVFDPKTGCPVVAPPGSIKLDDVAVIQACLMYPVMPVDGCAVVIHPSWGTAVYPSVMLSSAPPECVERAANGVLGNGGVVANESWYRMRSEYHHSFIG